MVFFFFFFLTRAPDAIERTRGGSKIFLKRGQGLHHYKMTSTSSHVSFNLECYLILDFGQQQVISGREGRVQKPCTPLLDPSLRMFGSSREVWKRKVGSMGGSTVLVTNTWEQNWRILMNYVINSTTTRHLLHNNVSNNTCFCLESNSKIQSP